MDGWTGVIGSKPKARNFENKKTEGKIGVQILDSMAGLGRPSLERIA
ncbi:MAG: hypothetical protein ABJH07_24920 [Sedimentitalea sp.]